MKKIHWQIPDLSKDSKSYLQARNSKRAVVDLFLVFLLYISLLSLISYFIAESNLLLVIALMPALGLVVTFFGWAGRGHEYFHATAFKNSKFSRFFFRLFSCMTWSNWGYFEISHWIHHKETLHLGDPEGPPSRELSLRNLGWLILVDLPTLFRRFWILVLNSFGLVPRSNEIIRNLIQEKDFLKKRLTIGARSVLLYQFSAFVFFSFHSLKLSIVSLVAPFTFTLINRTLELSQHFGLQRNATDFRENTRTIELGKALQFLYANMNFHQEHHMFPSIPYYNLPKVHEELKRSGEVPQPHFGYLAALRIAFENPQRYAAKHFDCLSCRVACPLQPLKLDREH